MLTAMGKMVQQIATINNLLIFINIQISQLQKSNEGRVSGEGPALAGISSLPPKAGEGRGRPGKAGLLPVLGGGGSCSRTWAPHPQLWGLDVRALQWLPLLAWSGRGLPLPWAQGTKAPAPTAQVSDLLVLPGSGGVGRLGDQSPGAGQAWQPLPIHE